MDSTFISKIEKLDFEDIKKFKNKIDFRLEKELQIIKLGSI